MKYNDEVAVTVMHGKHEVWAYVTFLQGLKLTQFLDADKAQVVLTGLRATSWKETHLKGGNKEIWKFQP